MTHPNDYFAWKKRYCSWQNDAPQKCQHANLRTLWICYLIWQRDFEGVVKLRVSIWRHYPGHFRGVQCHHKKPHKQEAGGQGGEELLWRWILWSRKGPQVASRSGKIRKRKRNFPLKRRNKKRRKKSAVDILTLTPWDSFQNSNPQKIQTINLYDLSH